MPLPKPQGSETEDEFVGRCMADETMEAEFPEQGQRYAVCQTLYEQGKAMDNRQMKAHIKQDGESYRIVATTRDIDRDGEVVEPSGVSNFDDYLSRNPVILFAHDYGQPPVGKATGGEITDDSIELDIEWADTEFGREVKYLYDNGFMSSFSIGFIPRDYKTINDTWHWTQWELLEVSAVPVPANSMANIIRTIEQSGESMPQLKSMYRDATGGAETAETRVAAKRMQEDTWRFYIDWLKKPTVR
jgi:HK97 family phage prohead protease